MHELGSSILLVPSALAAEAKQDAWLAVVCAIGMHLVWIPLYVALARQMKTRTVGDHLQKLFGPLGRRLLLPVFIVMFPYLIFVLTLRNLGDFLSTSIIPQTPIEVVYAIMLTGVLYALRSGIKPLGRTVEILFPLVAFLLAILILSILPSIQLDEFLPVLEDGWKPPVRSAMLLAAFPYMEYMVFLFFVPRLEEPQKFKRVLFVSSLISGAFFLIITCEVILVLSPEVTENLTFPTYFVARTISVADFYERFEIIISVLWIISIFLRLSLLMYAAAQGFAESCSLKDYHSLLIPLGVISLIMANVVWPNIPYLFEFFKVWPSYAMVFGYLLPLILWGAGKRKELKGQL